MSKLPTEVKLTLHAQQRLEERNKNKIYNTKNLMKSSCKWYGKDDLIPNSKLYIHCLYVCRKARNKMRYMTDGNIEVLYDKNAGVAITVMEVKEKFLPITQFVKPEVLKEIKVKKENKKMRKKVTAYSTCPDCGQENVSINVIHGICEKCYIRKINATRKGKEYVPYVNLSEEEKRKVDIHREAHRKKREQHNETDTTISTVQVPENYYQVKATQKTVTSPTSVVQQKTSTDVLSDPDSLIKILRSYGSEIPEDNLKEILNVLVSTDHLRKAFMTVAENDNQQAMLDLDQTLNVVERKLQHDWEYNGFQEADDIKFKGFLTWRRTLKGAIYFWKKIYSTGVLLELQRAWDTYIADPTEKVVMSGERMTSILKRYQITTDSISTIFNTRKPFTRVFYAMSEADAYDKFSKWMTDRQLHEDKSKTTIVELSNDGKDVREKED